MKPRLHVFGHMHETAGEVSSDGATLYVNASTVDPHYEVALSPCTVVDLPRDPSRPPSVVRPRLDWNPAQVGEWLEREGLPAWGGGLREWGSTGQDLCDREELTWFEGRTGPGAGRENVASFKQAVVRLRARSYPRHQPRPARVPRQITSSRAGHKTFFPYRSGHEGCG